ncbi:HlyD family efflux transporter periplasmic adaptor subunit [Bythopirellula goksoeyrii]|uniref:HlyD family secretion protein n=1 Tax=Bythopirellula goksoeyrii TaxID=1400387 RepID=A0A5B9QD25_9BACT|nr:HlyD family efflux transporter periplasmic adaptor subunit [Bythopirellula goksoeyrii]QEG36794.1 HlyD family secretion protein [Bythopirellula goksoeyrii]
MSNPTDYLLATANRLLGLRSRGDIAPVAVSYGGQESFVLKDPLTLEVFQLSAAEMFLFDELRKENSLADLQKCFEAKFAPRTITHAALQQAVAQLFDQGLLVSTAAGQGRELLDRATKRRRNERWQSLVRVLSFRVASWDATATIESLYSNVRWLFSPVVGVAAVTMVVYAIWLLVGHWTQFAARMPSISELTTPNYLLLWLLTIAGVKVLHELGHAVTCRHVGSRCHEMGIMLLALLPCLYCDVSDVWKLPSKWQRMAVSAAGMIVELVIAAGAVILWWHTEPGLLHTWLLGLAIICSISTLAVNANPLLRYDGYYLLADLLEIPNLSGRASGLWGERLRDWLLGQPHTADPLISTIQQRRLAIYAVAARIYSVVILLAIFAMLLAVARPYHLEKIVFLLAGVTVVGMIVGPCLGIWRVIRNPINRYRLRKLRVSLLSAFLAGVAGLLFFYPIRHTVEGSVVFVPAEGHAIYATEPGQLEFALSAGTQVQPGDTIARLVDPQVELSLVEYRGELAEKRMHVDQLKTLRALDPRMSLQLPTAESELRDAESQLAQYNQRASTLDLQAPIAGTVIAPPVVEHKRSSNRLPTWSGTPLDSKNQQCWVEPGTVLCTIGDPERVSALVTVDERDIAEVEVGDNVRILLGSAPVRILTGTVSQVASRATRTDSELSEIDANRFHVVEVQLDQQDGQALLGSTGKAKIDANRATIAQLATDFVKRKLRLPW